MNAPQHKTYSVALSFVPEESGVDPEVMQKWFRENFPYGMVEDVLLMKDTSLERLRFQALCEKLGADQAKSSLEDMKRIGEFLQDRSLRNSLKEMALKLGSSSDLAKEIEGYAAQMRPTDDPVMEVERLLSDRSPGERVELLRRLESARQLATEKKDLLIEMADYMIPVPAGEEYESLRLQQQMIKPRFDLDTLLATPSIIEGSIWSAFLEYKKIYRAQYLKEFEAYRTEVTRLHQHYHTLEQKVQACEILDQLEELGSPVAPPIRQQFHAFFTEYPVPDITPADLSDFLEHAPVYGSFCLGKCVRRENFITLQEDIDRQLSHKLRIIQARTIGHLETEKQSDAKKLLDMIQLSRIDDLMELLTQDSTGQVLRSLHTLLKSKS